MSAAVIATPSFASDAPTSTSGPPSAPTYSPALVDALSNSSAILSTLTRRFRANAQRARHMFLANYAQQTTPADSNAASASASSSTSTSTFDAASTTIKLRVKIASEYSNMPSSTAAAPTASTSGVGVSSTALSRQSRLVEEATGVMRAVEVEDEIVTTQPRSTEELLDRLPTATPATAAAASSSAVAAGVSSALVSYASSSGQALVPSAGLTARQMLINSKREIDDVRPEWHAPWKLMRVIPAHSGWVRCIAVDHSNEWFVTGSADRTIKIFDLASGNLRLTLTGHISAVRALVISKLMPYMFSVGEDKTVKCWDMEQNKVIRDYHGHLSGGYCGNLLENEGGPNILVTGGRDSVARVWDIRTAAEVGVLCGHTQTVASIQCQMGLPQVITGSHDCCVKLWDLRKTSAPISTLTHHKKSVRALQIHPTEYTFTSGAADNLKVFKCPDGTFLRNISGHNATINALAINRENVLVSGGDNGSMHFWDYKSGHSFQSFQTQPQPGSLDAESDIFALTFDQTGSRLLTAEADKSIKVYKEDPDATEETHPLSWRPGKRRKL